MLAKEQWMSVSFIVIFICMNEWEGSIPQGVLNDSDEIYVF